MVRKVKNCINCGKELGENAPWNRAKRCKKCNYLYSKDKRSKLFKYNILIRTLNDYDETSKTLSLVSNEWKIWFTGFWEGEGSLCECKNTKSKIKSFNFSITQKDKIILKYQKFFKFGKVNDYFKNSCYQWLFGGSGHIIPFIQFMIPYIQIKKRKIQIKKFLKNDYILFCIKQLYKNHKLSKQQYKTLITYA